jgi:hypothetical protein
MSVPLRDDRVARWKIFAALCVVALAALASLAIAPRLADHIGLSIGRGGWFVDLHAVLAASDAHARGLDIHRYNPLDVYGRPHSYSNWWLALGDVGLTRADTRWLGATLVGAFIAVAAWMIRATTVRQLAFAAALFASPAVLLSLVRANNDLVVFLVLALLVPLLTHASPVARFAAAAFIAWAAGLKYYPAVAALLLLHEKTLRVFIWRTVLSVALVAVVLIGVYEDTLHFAQTLPAPAALFSLGAPGIFSFVGLPSWWRWLAFAVVVVVSLFGVPRDVPTALTRNDLHFVLGSVLIVACFWMLIVACFWITINWAYRWVFSLWLLPVLLGAPGDTALLRPWQWGALRVLLPLCLWWDGLCSLFWNVGLGPRVGLSLERYSEIGWLLIQPVHWAVAALLTGVCVRFARDESRIRAEQVRAALALRA